MSVLFPKVNKPREWDYRPIYYNEEKEARNEKLARLHRGSFREQHEKLKIHNAAQRKSKLAFWIALLVLLLFAFFILNIKL